MRRAVLASLLLLAIPARADEAPGFTFHLFGFLRLKGALVADDPNVAFVGRNDGFVLQNARIGLDAAWKDRLTARVSADGAVDERAGVNATTGTLRFALKDAYLDIRVAAPLTVRVVRFEPIFDLEELIPYTERQFVDRSLESRGVLATQGYETPGLSPGRSIGVALRADKAAEFGAGAFGYELSAQNGNGEYESENDNDSVAFAAALFVTYGRSLLFVAGRQKSYTLGNLPFRQTQDELAGAAGVIVRVGPVELTAQGITRHTTFPTTGGPAQNSAGGHAQAAVAIGLGSAATLTPAFRFAIFDPSDLIATDRVQELTGGLTLSFSTLPIRIQLDYTHPVEQAQRALKNDRLEAGFEVVL